MDKIDIDGYFYFKDFKDEEYLMIADEDYDIVFDYIKEKKVKNIYLSFIAGNSGENLKFLQEITFFEKIRVFFRQSVDLTGLYFQKELKELYITGHDQALEWNTFSELKALLLTDLKKPLDHLEFTKLKELSLNNLKNSDLTFLEKCLGIDALTINDSRTLKSLKGIEDLPLKILELSYLPKLSDLGNFKKFEKLERLSIENCSTIGSLAGFKDLHNLKRLEIMKCRQIDSLDFLKNLKKIESVFIEKTKVLDGIIPEYVTVIK